MRVTVIQPAVPVYRLDFFQRLSDRLGQDFAVYSSRQKALGVLEAGGDRIAWLRPLGSMRSLLPGLEWQSGVLSVPISRGDVLVVCGAPRTLSTLVLLIKGRLRGAKTIWWGHYWSATSKPWRMALRLALMRIADAVLFYTDQEVAEYRARKGGNLSKPVVGLNNGIDTGKIVRLRKPYLPEERSRDLLFIGRITQKAEFDLLIDALSRPECAYITLDVIGDGDGMPYIKERAESLGLSNRIIWHGALVHEPDIAAIANRCKVFVYPGCVGLSLIHGLAYGLPAVVHNDRWRHMPEIAALDIGANGRVFVRGSAPALAAEVAALLNDNDALLRMSAAAVATTERSFNSVDMVNRFCSLLSAELNNCTRGLV